MVRAAERCDETDAARAETASSAVVAAAKSGLEAAVREKLGRPKKRSRRPRNHDTSRRPTVLAVPRDGGLAQATLRGKKTALRVLQLTEREVILELGAGWSRSALDACPRQPNILADVRPAPSDKVALSGLVPKSHLGLEDALGGRTLSRSIFTSPAASSSVLRRRLVPSRREARYLKFVYRRAKHATSERQLLVLLCLAYVKRHPEGGRERVSKVLNSARARANASQVR